MSEQITLRFDGNIALIQDFNSVSPYAVFRWTGNFWQQSSKWYFYKKYAIKEYEYQCYQQSKDSLKLVQEV